MEYIWEYVEKLVAFVILCNIMKNIMPEGKDNKIIRLMIGGIMTLIMLQPVMALKGMDVSVFINIEEYNINKTGNIESGLYEKMYESEINNVLASKGITGNVRVKCNDKNVAGVDVELKKNNSGLSDEELSTYVTEGIASMFGIDRRHVNVRNIKKNRE